MNASTLKLKPGQSLLAPETTPEDSISESLVRSVTKQYKVNPTLNLNASAHTKTNAEKFSDESYQYQRKSSILSYQNLSIGDCTSVTDSTYSHYNPSINEPVLSADADQDEKAMHAFLDCCGVFQVNVNMQIEEEKKSACSVSPSLKQRLSFMRSKNSPSFMERRRRLLSNKDSTKASSTGGQSTSLRIQLNQTQPAFSTEIFTANTGQSKASSVPNQVAEEPNSGTSIRKDGNQIEISCASAEGSLTPPPIVQNKIPFGLQMLSKSNDNTSDQGHSHMELLHPSEPEYASTRHQSLTPPPMSKLQEEQHSSSGLQQSELRNRFERPIDAASSDSGFSLRVQQAEKLNKQSQDHYGLERTESDPPQIQSRRQFFQGLKLGIPANTFSAGNASDTPHSAASFSGFGAGNSPDKNEPCQFDGDNHTPTLPGRRDSSEQKVEYTDLDKEMLGDNPNPGNDQVVTKGPLSNVNLVDREDLSFFSPDAMKEAREAGKEPTHIVQARHSVELMPQSTPDTPFFKSTMRDTSPSLTGAESFKSSQGNLEQSAVRAQPTISKLE